MALKKTLVAGQYSACMQYRSTDLYLPPARAAPLVYRTVPRTEIEDSALRRHIVHREVGYGLIGRLRALNGLGFAREGKDVVVCPFSDVYSHLINAEGAYTEPQA